MHIYLNVDSDATTDPPTQADFDGSGEEITLINAEGGFMLTISDRNRSTKPGYFVEPPALGRDQSSALELDVRSEKSAYRNNILVKQMLNLSITLAN